MIGLPAKDSVDAMSDFVARHGLDGMLQIVDGDREISIWQQYGIGYQPAWVFIDDDGTVTVHPGALSDEALHQALDDLIAS